MEETLVRFIPDPTFEVPSLAEAIVAPMPGGEEYEAQRRAMSVPQGVSTGLEMFYVAPRLTKEQEHHLFRHMNFLKFLASRLQGDAAHAGRVNDLCKQAEAVRNVLVAANLRLIVPVAKRQAGWPNEQGTLFSDGALAILRAAEKFDYTRGLQFSTYATRAIQNAYIASWRRQPSREVCAGTFDQLLDEPADTEEGPIRRAAKASPEAKRFLSDPDDDRGARAEQQSLRLDHLLNSLPPRDQQVLRLRYGLDEARAARTLDAVSTELGVTKQRVRQIETRAMARLRQSDLAACC